MVVSGVCEECVCVCVCGWVGVNHIDCVPVKEHSVVVSGVCVCVGVCVGVGVNHIVLFLAPVNELTVLSIILPRRSLDSGGGTRRQ